MSQLNTYNTSIGFFVQTRLFTETFSGTTTIHPDIFHGWALWADSVSPGTNTIASRDQFKPIRIGENLVVNYSWVAASTSFPDVQILVEVFCTNLQSPVWSRHVGLPPRDTNMLGGRKIV